MRFVLWRILQGLVSILVVTTIVFGATRLMGDPVSVLLPEDATLEMYNQLQREMGFDRPFAVQYVEYFGRLLSGDLGTSVRTRGSVAALVGSRMSATLELGVSALVVSLAVGVPLGLYAGYWRGGTFDHVSRFFAVLGQAAPPFWVGILLILLVAIHLGWLPAGGRGTPRHLVLPTLTMAWGAIAGVTRLMRSSLLETMESDYIRFCRIKGIRESQLLWKHGLRNAVLPTLTFSGILAGGLITGSIVTEVVFVWPGMGQLLIDSITFRDFPTVQAIVIFFAVVYIVMALLVDILYAVLNPLLRSG